MATVLSRATGNWLTAGTWETIDATSYVNSESATGTVTTSYTASAGATTGVITATGIGLKLSVRTGTTGTLSTHLAIAGVEVPGTLVTINTADLPVAATADLNGGWIFFKFSAGVLLAGATSYTVEVKTSSSSQVGLFSTSGTAWSHFISTNASAAPVAGDDVIIAGEYTGAGTSNSFTVTMDETATTDYGANSSSLVTPSLAICDKGTLSYATNIAAYLRQSGHGIIYSGGSLIKGSVATPIARGSSAELNFDVGTNVAFGLTIRNLGTYIDQGLSRTSGKNIYYCKLNTDEAMNSTSLGVDTVTGWLDNDEIGVATTTRTASQCETGRLNGNANASDMTVDGFAGAGGGLAFAHSGTSPTQAEVVLLTRNSRVTGVSASLQTFIDIKPTATVDFDWVEFKWMGSGTTNKRGFDVATTTGSATWHYCSLHQFVVGSSYGLNVTSTSGNGFTFNNNVTFAVDWRHIENVATTAPWTMDGNVFMRGVSAQLVRLSDCGGTFTNNILTGSPNVGLALIEVSLAPGSAGTWSGNSFHGNANSHIIFQGSPNMNFTFTNTTMWRSNGSGLDLSGNTNGGGLSNILFNGMTCFGNATNNVSFNGNATNITFVSGTFNGDSSFSTTNGAIFGSPTPNYSGIVFVSCDFGTASGIKTAHTNDINISVRGAMQIFLNNTILASATEVATQSNLNTGLTPNMSAFVASQKHDQTAGNNKMWLGVGTIDRETTITHTGGQSIRLLPTSATEKLVCGGAFGGFKVAVASGSTLTPSVYVYESAAYNGNRCRLIVKRNDAIGITADTVLDTRTGASDATWELMTGTTIAVTADGVAEFVVDGDGTAGTGYFYCDSFTCA